MMDDLPEWYPLANASDAQIDRWLAAEKPPYDEMRAALPWLDQPYQFDAWVVGIREARRRADLGGIADAFSATRLIPLPPRRLAGRAAR
jgi:hypothetical protein